jgi:phosphoserine phosphatase RsbU/P
MISSQPLLRYRFPACADQMGSVRQKLREALSGRSQSELDINNVVLAVGEACMNIIQHAYGQHDKGDIVLEVDEVVGNLAHAGLTTDATTNSQRQLIFRLIDFAKHKSCAEEMRSRPLDELRPGGLGCFIMREVMDEVTLLDCHDSNGNVLQMRKKLNC